MPSIKLMLNYTIETTTDAEFDLDVDEYAIWCIAMGHDLDDALKREDLILTFLTNGLGHEEVAARMPWGETILGIWQADIITDEMRPQ